MRVFIAIDIEPAIKKALGRLKDKMAGELDVRRGDLKWVEPDSTHLTLKFLGEVTDQQLVEICAITEEVAGLHKSFDIDIETVGFFGGRSARVVWVGAGLENKELLRLKAELEGRLESAGWPRENREFSGHLTLCRVKDSRAGVKLAQLAGQYKNFKIGPMSVDSINVYQSELTPKGPIYTVLGSYGLK